jgi:aminoglycoside phosphotransferase (APT) family kinase protein
MRYEDQPGPIREGEQLDPKRLAAYLGHVLPDLRGPLALQQFPSGHSNLTYLLRFGGRELVLRRPPFGRKAATAHDMAREYRMLTALKPFFKYCPAALHLCEDASVIGAPFFLMERIRGIILRRQLPPGLSLNTAQSAALCRHLLAVQLELHNLDFRQLGLEDIGRPKGYVARQVAGWSERYRTARTPDAPDFEAVMAWLEGHRPPDAGRGAVIHNDFRFDNLVLATDPTPRIIGVLDWEMATVGDPLMDLGCSLAYWVQADDPPELQAIRLMPTHLPGMLTRRQLVEGYADMAGTGGVDFVFYYCFGLFRLAAIAQQIYYRYYYKQTHDERFKGLIGAVAVLEKAALRLIDSAGL